MIAVENSVEGPNIQRKNLIESKLSNWLADEGYRRKTSICKSWIRDRKCSSTKYKIFFV